MELYQKFLLIGCIFAGIGVVFVILALIVQK